MTYDGMNGVVFTIISYYHRYVILMKIIDDKLTVSLGTLNYYHFFLLVSDEWDHALTLRYQPMQVQVVSL